MKVIVFEKKVGGEPMQRVLKAVRISLSYIQHAIRCSEGNPSWVEGQIRMAVGVRSGNRL